MGDGVYSGPAHEAWLQASTTAQPPKFTRFLSHDTASFSLKGTSLEEVNIFMF